MPGAPESGAPTMGAGATESAGAAVGAAVKASGEGAASSAAAAVMSPEGFGRTPDIKSGGASETFGQDPNQHVSSEIGVSADKISGMSSEDIHASLERFVGPTAEGTDAKPGDVQPPGPDGQQNVNEVHPAADPLPDARQETQTDPAAAQNSAEQNGAKQDWENWQQQAQFREPTADERATGAKVEPTTTESTQDDRQQQKDVDKPAEGEQEDTDKPAEGKQEGEKTKEDAEMVDRERSLIAKLARLNPDFDPTDPKVREFLDKAVYNPEIMDTAEQTLEMAGQKAKDAESDAEAYINNLGLPPEQAKELASKLFSGEMQTLLDFFKDQEKTLTENQSGDNATKLMKTKMVLFLLALAALAPMALMMNQTAKQGQK